MASSGGSMSLQPRNDTLISVVAKHQLWPNAKPSFKGISVAQKTAVITGGNTGLGLESSKLLLSLQLARLVIGVRSLQKGEEAAASLRKLHPKAKIDVWHLDLNSDHSVREFARKCADLPRLDIAILSAGIMNVGFRASPHTKHEETFQVNYLSTALLSLLLLPLLKKKNSPSEGPGRLTLVASGAALIAEFAERNESQLIPAFDKPGEWSSSVAKKRYDTSKGLVLMLTYKLSQLVKSEDVVVNVVDPTFTPGTSFFRSVPLLVRILTWPLVTLLGTSVNNAAWRYVDAAVARGQESHGSFVSDWVINPFHAFMYTEDGADFMDRLWAETVEELDYPEVRDAMKALVAG